MTQTASAHDQRAFEINPDLAQTHFRLANILRTLGRHDEAIVHYRQALAIRPDFVEAHSNLGGSVGRWRGYADMLQPLLQALDVEHDRAGAAR
jgi:tetratricopeptide (TPR) repeat protein